MFERFTDRCRHVIVLAQDEARLLSHNYIGTEHLLLGLLREEASVGARALVSLGVSLDAVRDEVERIIGRGETPPRGHIPFTPRAKLVLELALREALELGHDYIGTEHMVLGLVQEGEGVAVQILVARGVDLVRLRRAVLDLIGAPADKRWRTARRRRGAWTAPEPVTLEVDDRLRAIEVVLEHIATRLDAIERRLPPEAAQGP